MSASRTMLALTLGQSARIVDVHGEDAMQSRLMELGLTRGATITLIRRSPFGDPLQFRVGGSDFAIRRALASRVLIEPEPEHEPEHEPEPEHEEEDSR